MWRQAWHPMNVTCIAPSSVLRHGVIFFGGQRPEWGINDLFATLIPLDIHEKKAECDAPYGD